MEVKYFKLVTAIADAGSLTKAADKLFLTQSALSHQLKEIETQLGCTLFTRVNKRLVITNAGVAFLNSAAIVLNEISKLQSDIQRLTVGETGKIRLITQSSTCYHWLPRILRNFQNNYPNVDVHLNSTPVSNPIPLLAAGKVDVALVHRKDADKNVEYIELFTDEVVALVPVDDMLSSKPYLVPKDFSHVTYLTHSRQIEDSAFLTDFLKPHGITPKKIVHFELTETIVSMVNEALGMTVMANWLALPYQQSARIKLVRITRSGLKRRWYIATLKHGGPAYLAKFVSVLETGISAGLRV